MSSLIFGCGYLGMRVARLWQQTNRTVHVVTRSSERAADFSSLGLNPIVADILQPASLQNLPAAQTVLFAVGYDRSAGSIERVFVQGLANVLETLPPQTERFLYVSSTGVYAQADGRWVDEQSPCDPVRKGGLACLNAEHVLQRHALGERSVVLRLAGIYGPGRIPRRKDLAEGRPLDAPGEGYLNLIHVDDAARAVLVAELRSPAPAVYCIADGHPVLRSQYYAELARLIGAPRPTFLPPPPGSPALERARSSKRVKNDRFVQRCGFSLRYPSFREGLAAIVAAERE